MKKVIWSRTGTRSVTVISADAGNSVREAMKIFSALSLTVLSSEIVPDDQNNYELKYIVSGGKSADIFDFAVNKLRMTDGVLSVHIE